MGTGVAYLASLTHSRVSLSWNPSLQVLPGAQLISGQGIPRIQIQEDLLSIYLVSRGFIFGFFVLYLAFSADRSDGWGYQHYLLAWALSLFAQFKAGPSVVWLGLTTGFFLQGIGVSPRTSIS